MGNSITSDTLIPIDQPFRVEAGPGAGKTYWLIKHINNVLSRSTRLEKVRKIACITYTNIGVDTINSRLKGVGDRVYTATIHSFLYDNIVKPYIGFIAEEMGINKSALSLPSEDWSFKGDILSKLLSLSKGIGTDDIKLALPYAFWQVDNDSYVFKPRKLYWTKKRRAMPESVYGEYKRLCWQQGILSYDDILAISLFIISKFPVVAKIITGRFPYIFVDEFQDSNPIQTNIIKLLSDNGCTIGIIGDAAQSIYGFQGVIPDTMAKFTVDGIMDYTITSNRRSTQKIINFLNHIRADLQQTPVDITVEGTMPCVIIGNPQDALTKAEEFVGKNVVSLSYSNAMANAMNKGVMDVDVDKLRKQFLQIDSNDDRRRIVEIFIRSIEYAVAKNYKKSQQEINKLLNIEDELDTRLYKIMIKLLSNYDTIKAMTLFELVTYIRGLGFEISTFRAGLIKTFYENTMYNDICLAYGLQDTELPHRTIHKVKGSEIDHVLLVLGKPEDIEFITTPDLRKENHRVYYVAASRAKHNLFINMPSLTKKDETVLNNTGLVRVVRLL